jgi:hypothetical protein
MNSWNDDHGESTRHPPRRPWPAVAAIVLSAALTGAFAATSPIVVGDHVTPDTQLALSADGRQLLVTSQDRNGTRARLLTIADRAVVSARDVAVPAATFTVAFGRMDDHIIVTTRNGAASDLVRVNLEAGTQTLIYSSASLMRFPREIAEGKYVFLEANEPGGRFSRWQKLESGTKKLLNDRPYSLATPMQHAREALFLLEPTRPPSFRVFEGALPAGIASLVQPSTYAFKCADDDPLTCLRMDVHFDPTGRPVVIIYALTGGRQCEISGQWGTDVRELAISRDGTTIVFHAPIDAAKKVRAIYVARNNGPDCTAK